jgi:molybdenum cofactor cytidylyltransferase
VKFGTLNLDNAVGAILAHGVTHADGMFKKGRTLSATDVKALQALGYETVVAAKLGDSDVPEDSAAHQVAIAICGTGVKAQQAFTGRANVHSITHGLVVIDDVRVRALNHLHESLTLATLANLSVVEPRQMVATNKVIPFAVPRQILDAALALIGNEPLLRVQEFVTHKAGLVITRLPQTKPSLIVKSEASIRHRIAALGSELTNVIICDHSQSEVAAAITSLQTKVCDPILVFGASAIVDRADVIPSGLVGAGGSVIHLGMPVDPGNLLMLGNLNGTPVIGVPSCARSPKLNGFDWVLERIIARLPVGRAEIMDMGAGGLLAEIASRPSPREPKTKPQSAPRIVAIILAAGKSSRMRSNKMLADFHDQPMLRATFTSIAASSVDEIIVVLGHEHDKVSKALSGLNARLVINPDFGKGLATSLAVGVREAAAADAVLVCLGDMPLVSSDLIDRLIAAFNANESRNIIVPIYNGQRGNPILWGRAYFERLNSLSGDHGARGLVDEFNFDTVEIEAATDEVLKDADTPVELANLRLRE